MLRPNDIGGPSVHSSWSQHRPASANYQREIQIVNFAFRFFFFPKKKNWKCFSWTKNFRIRRVLIPLIWSAVTLADSNKLRKVRCVVLVTSIERNQRTSNDQRRSSPIQLLVKSKWFTTELIRKSTTISRYSSPSMKFKSCSSIAEAKTFRFTKEIFGQAKNLRFNHVDITIFRLACRCTSKVWSTVEFRRVASTNIDTEWNWAANEVISPSYLSKDRNLASSIFSSCSEKFKENFVCLKMSIWETDSIETNVERNRRGKCRQTDHDFDSG